LGSNFSFEKRAVNLSFYPTRRDVRYQTTQPDRVVILNISPCFDAWPLLFLLHTQHVTVWSNVQKGRKVEWTCRITHAHTHTQTVRLTVTTGSQTVYINIFIPPAGTLQNEIGPNPGRTGCSPVVSYSRGFGDVGHVRGEPIKTVVHPRFCQETLVCLFFLRRCPVLVDKSCVSTMCVFFSTFGKPTGVRRIHSRNNHSSICVSCTRSTKLIVGSCSSRRFAVGCENGQPRGQQEYRSQ
jgi:hypothetical protein